MEDTAHNLMPTRHGFVHFENPMMPTMRRIRTDIETTHPSPNDPFDLQDDPSDLFMNLPLDSTSPLLSPLSPPVLSSLSPPLPSYPASREVPRTSTDLSYLSHISPLSPQSSLSPEATHSKNKIHLSFGTTFHDKGTCNPCRYEWTRGCHLGVQCRFCHHEDHTPPGAFRVDANSATTATVSIGSSNDRVAPSNCRVLPATNANNSIGNANIRNMSINNSFSNASVRANVSNNANNCIGNTMNPFPISNQGSRGTNNSYIPQLLPCQCNGLDPNCLALQSAFELLTFARQMYLSVSQSHMKK